jgi:hypothetical protein
LVDRKSRYTRQLNTAREFGSRRVKPRNKTDVRVAFLRYCIPREYICTIHIYVHIYVLLSVNIYKTLYILLQLDEGVRDSRWRSAPLGGSVIYTYSSAIEA